MMARPGYLPRPARPTTWVSKSKVRSLLRKSSLNRAWSAESTPTKVTFSKSRPLATIWVPTMTSYSPRANWSSFFSREYLAATESVSTRSTRASGSSCWSCSSARWVPAPRKVTVSLPQEGQWRE